MKKSKKIQLTSRVTGFCASRGVFRGALFASAFLFAGSVSASPAFPAELQTVAAMTCTPSCTVCHTTNPGRAGSASQPFALSMTDEDVVGEGNELVAGDVETVALAYAGLPDELDSDGDKVADKLELETEETQDPSVPGAGSPCAAEVKYGCAAQVARGPVDNARYFWPLLLAALASVMFVRRRPS